jgi:hypothetical protein
MALGDGMLHPGRVTTALGPVTVLRRSIRDRGARATLSAVGERVGDALYDLRRGIWTVNPISLDGLFIVGDRRGGVDYAPTRARSFGRVLSELGVPATGRFVDFGCGKGRVLVLAMEYGFEWVLADARQYRIDPLDKVFYFFNPFDADVMTVVLDNIESSLAAAPREAWLVYANPENRQLIDQSPVWTSIGERRLAGGMRYVGYHSPGVPEGLRRPLAVPSERHVDSRSASWQST